MISKVKSEMSFLRYDEALMKYLLLAELGYEVAQSNAAFIMDRKETELFQVDELWKRALVYWTRYTMISFINDIETILFYPQGRGPGLQRSQSETG